MVSNPKSLSKLHDVVARHLRGDAGRFEAPLCDGRSGAGARRVLVSEDLKASHELGIPFSAFVHEHGLANLLSAAVWVLGA